MDPDPGPIDVLYVGPDRTTGFDGTSADALERASGRLSVTAVRDVGTGLERLRETPVDCVVSGYRLPDGTGIEFLERVRAEDPDLPVVIVAGEESDTVAREAFAAGATGYLPRGHGDHHATLADRIEDAVDARRARTERDAVLNRMSDAFFAVDADWRFTYLNAAGREVIREAAAEDLPEGELAGRNIWEVIPEAVDTTFYERYHEAMATQETVSFEAYYEPMETWFEVRAYPSESGLSVYFRDVTADRNRRHELERRQRVLREVYDVISDLDRTFEEQIGALLDIGREVLGTDYGTLSRVRDDRYVFEVVRGPEDPLVREGDVVDLSATYCERSVATEGTLVLADVASEAPDLTDRDGFAELGIQCYVGTPVDIDDEVYGTFCFYDTDPDHDPFSEWQVTLVDLMGRWVSYELEHQRVTERLRRQNERLGDFASILSHDLRNPLNVAVGGVDLARSECDSEHLDRVERAHDRMEALISDVLTMAREGEAVEETEPLSLGAVARDAWESIEAPGFTLEIEGDSTVAADRSRLMRILENLLRNSVEHGPEDAADGDPGDPPGRDGPGVTVRVGRLSGERGFYVEDDGRGIPEDERDRVFDYGHSTAREGTGYGLPIVRQLAEAHDWTVSVTESDDGGARFEFVGVDLR